MIDTLDILGCCENLTELEKRRALKELNVNPDDAPDKLSHANALWIWLTDLLSIMPLDKEAQLLVMDEFSPEFVRYGEAVGHHVDNRRSGKKEEAPVMLIGLGDRIYFAVTGSKDVINIKTGHRLPGVKLQFLETIQYNLATLFMTRYLKCVYKQPSGGESDAKLQGTDTTRECVC